MTSSDRIPDASVSARRCELRNERLFDELVEPVEVDVREQGAGHAPNDVAKSSLIPDSVISRTRLRPTYGQGWQPRLDPLPRQAEGRDLGEKEST